MDILLMIVLMLRFQNDFFVVTDIGIKWLKSSGPFNPDLIMIKLTATRYKTMG